jgi:predicted RNase H-like nuclease (RuvC/YqgF family)
MKAKSPARREWGSMRQRVLSLTQQVAALKATKESLTKSLNEQKFSNEKLQNDLNQSQQRGKLSKQTIEVIRNKFIS